MYKIIAAIVVVVFLSGCVTTVDDPWLGLREVTSQ